MPMPMLASGRHHAAPPTDRDLWTRLRAADEYALSDLFHRHADAVYNFAFRRTASWSVAEEVVGAIGRGNATAVAEYNVWHDPEAAAVVLDADVDLTMYGLDVFHTVAVDAPTIAELRRSSSPAASLAGDLLAHSHARNRSDPSLPPGGLLGDAGAVCVLADPSRLETEVRPVRVEVAPGLCRGQTVVDLWDERGEREVPGGSGHRMSVAVRVDADHYRDLFVSTLASGTGQDGSHVQRT